MVIDSNVFIGNRSVRRVALLAILASVVSPRVGWGQDPLEACRAFGRLSVGQWSEYRLGDGSGGGSVVRFAIVGTEARGGKSYYWYEFKGTRGRGNVIVQTLVPDFPYEKEQIQGMIGKFGDRPAERMPDAEVQRLRERSQGVRGPTEIDRGIPCRAVRALGWESVTVPAGTFRALHVKLRESDRDTDAWLSPDIPFGMVKVAMGAGHDVVLIAKGAGARSSIVEKPREGGQPTKPQ